MRQSLTEYTTALGRWGFLLIADLCLSGIGAYLDISGGVPIPRWVWLSTVLVGLTVAPFISFHRVRTERDRKSEQLRDLQETRPSIQVETVSDRYDVMFLKVTNLGEHGDFEAQIEMVEGRGFIHGIERPTLPIYTGCWELGLGPKASLPQGHSDRLLIGKLEVDHRFWSAGFHMYFYDGRAGRAKDFGTTSWQLVGKGTVAARFMLRITISSTPRMKQGPFIRTYLVDGEGDPHLQELPNATQSAPDREGSPIG
jgi:hypothetical protein